jgi:hypothetical protein
MEKIQNGVLKAYRQHGFRYLFHLFQTPGAFSDDTENIGSDQRSPGIANLIACALSLHHRDTALFISRFNPVPGKEIRQSESAIHLQ